ncbi:TPA: hypothetical protein ACQSPD_005934, partial [Pseudomonas aeruginosa]
VRHRVVVVGDVCGIRGRCFPALGGVRGTGRVVTAHRSDDSATCSNNAGWRSILLSLPHMMMPRHTGPAVTCRQV